MAVMFVEGSATEPDIRCKPRYRPLQQDPLTRLTLLVPYLRHTPHMKKAAWLMAFPSLHTQMRALSD